VGAGQQVGLRAIDLGARRRPRVNGTLSTDSPTGFVRVHGDDLSWPDDPGNNLFNSVGTLAVDPTATLLLVEFATGATGRRIRFTTQRVVRHD
jgi:hypothetical protein